eukprot:5527650-Amphidinium_carterae.1
MTIEIFTQAKQRHDENNPGQHNRFFLFLVQHYPHRLEHIFKQAGASPEDYHQVLLSNYFTLTRNVEITLQNRTGGFYRLYALLRLHKSNNENYNASHNYQRCNLRGGHSQYLKDNRKLKRTWMTLKRGQLREHQE